jgi:hypothetical protein
LTEIRQLAQFRRGKTAVKNNSLKAPDMQVLLSDGSTKELKDFWEEKPLVLVFLRHFG